MYREREIVKVIFLVRVVKYTSNSIHPIFTYICTIYNTLSLEPTSTLITPSLLLSPAHATRGHDTRGESFKSNIAGLFDLDIVHARLDAYIEF